MLRPCFRKPSTMVMRESNEKEEGRNLHFVTQMIHDLRDPGLDDLHRTPEARASITIQHRVVAQAFPTGLQKGVLFRVKAHALVQSVSR